ncbi:MAG: glycosyltransferase family 2 protein [Candidatus Thorarchaeota archaeon]
MRVVVTIPAYNESARIGGVIQRIPSAILEDNEVVILAFDDGSSDDTARIAKKSGAHMVYRHPENRGVGHAYKNSVRAALHCSADILVNIDADGQFDPTELSIIARPIANNEADVVIGSRFINDCDSMPLTKSIANHILTLLTSLLSGQRITDAQSGFRAISRRAAEQLRICGYFTYTQEMILDLASKGFTITEKPVSVRYFHSRKSRVVKGFLHYATRVLGLLLITSLRIHKRRILGVILGTAAAITMLGLLSGFM